MPGANRPGGGWLLHPPDRARLSDRRLSLSPAPGLCVSGVKHSGSWFLRWQGQFDAEFGAAFRAGAGRQVAAEVMDDVPGNGQAQPQALGHALFLLERKLRQGGVRVHNRCPAGPWRVWCEPVRLEQVLVNLIGNAIDAMAGQRERRLSFAVAAAGEDRLALSVSDTGSGFSPSALAHLFEPFFTTKQPGEGLGLGLTISRDILRDFGGDLLAEAAPGGGARFVVLLPRPPHPQPEKGTP